VSILRHLRRVVLVLSLASSASFFYYIVLWNQYKSILPHSPQPAIGRTYVLNMHGVAAYASRSERRRIEGAEDLFMFLVLCTILGGALTDPDYRRRMGWRSLEAPRGPAV
jgi:hypothetical protein